MLAEEISGDCVDIIGPYRYIGNEIGLVYKAIYIIILIVVWFRITQDD